MIFFKYRNEFEKLNFHFLLGLMRGPCFSFFSLSALGTAGLLALKDKILGTGDLFSSFSVFFSLVEAGPVNLRNRSLPSFFSIFFSGFSSTFLSDFSTPFFFTFSFHNGRFLVLGFFDFFFRWRGFQLGF